MEALTCGNTEIAPQDLRITMNKLSRTQESSQRTGFAKEFKVPLACFVVVEEVTWSSPAEASDLFPFCALLSYIFLHNCKYHLRQ